MPAPPIGGGTGVSAISSMLASGGQGPPAAGNGSAPPPGQPAGAAGAGMDAIQSQLMQSIGRIREFGEAVKQFALEAPQVAEEAQQIQQILKQMVVKMAAPVAPQTSSSMAVPGGQMA